MAKLITFGCRLNSCESDVIQAITDELGVDDYTIINTCAVTAEAERQLRQKIRQLYREDPNIKIILTGCAAELSPESYLEIDGVVGIVSNQTKLLKDSYLKYANESNKKITERPIDKIRGFVQIQNGCDHLCTYCVVHFTRGKSVSFDKDVIISQIKQSLDRGFKELVLTGVNISSYGQDFSPKSNLAFIIQYILQKVPRLKRLRLSSLDPADIDDELISLIANEERIMPHIHESIQSGDNMILKRMLRRHSRETVIETNAKINELRPDVIFGADIITGFPTETDEMFENTHKLLKEGNLSLLHVFPYSIRKGTPAALMPQVSKKIAKQRAQLLRKSIDEILNQKLQKFIGTTVKVLAESGNEAKTDSFLSVRTSNKMQIGGEYMVKCIEIKDNVIYGEVCGAIE